MTKKSNQFHWHSLAKTNNSSENDWYTLKREEYLHENGLWIIQIHFCLVFCHLIHIFFPSFLCFVWFPLFGRCESKESIFCVFILRWTRNDKTNLSFWSIHKTSIYDLAINYNEKRTDTPLRRFYCILVFFFFRVSPFTNSVFILIDCDRHKLE